MYKLVVIAILCHILYGTDMSAQTDRQADIPTGVLNIGGLSLGIEYIFEHTCAYARWAHMHHFLSVCPSVRLSGVT